MPDSMEASLMMVKTEPADVIDKIEVEGKSNEDPNSEVDVIYTIGDVKDETKDDTVSNVKPEEVNVKEDISIAYALQKDAEEVGDNYVSSTCSTKDPLSFSKSDHTGICKENRCISMSTTRKIRKYSTEDIVRAVEAIRRGTSVSAASKQYNIPRVTLMYKSNGKSPINARMGPDTILTKQEENLLVKWLIKIADVGFPATKNQLLDSVQLLVKKLHRPNTFKNGRPGRKWYNSFMTRHPEVSERLTQNLTKCRSELNEGKIRNWFQEIGTYLEANNFNDVIKDPQRIYNADETAFFLAPNGVKCLIKKGDKTAYNFIGNDDKECVTCLVTANAAGSLLPPMVIYSYERIPSHLANAIPSKWAIGKSESGWMTSQIFYEFVTNIFHPWLIENEVPLPVIFFVDGNASRLTMELSEFCSRNGIILLALFPNATRILQPMDVAVFHPLKSAWKKGVHTYKMENDGQKVKKEVFAPLLKKVLDESITKEMIQDGFRTCGLFPFNANGIDYSKYFKAEFQEIVQASAKEKLKKEFLQYLEQKIGAEKLHEFKSCEEQWSGVIEDTNLFLLWRELSNELKTLNNNIELIEPFIQEVNSSEDDPEPDTIELTANATVSRTIQNKNETTPDKESPDNTADEASCSTSIIDISDVPTPIKTFLFRPEVSASSKPKRTKEKIPSVATSQFWKDYHRRKQEKKEDVQKAKPLNKSKRKRESSSDSSISVILESEDEGTKDSSIAFEIGDFVIVRYSNQYYPGRIIDIDMSDLEYSVSAMTQSGLLNWKWPNIPDTMWYARDDIIQKIQEPQVRSNRGVYICPEMKKFREFSA